MPARHFQWLEENNKKQLYQLLLISSFVLIQSERTKVRESKTG
ncbi:unnamed protein product [Brassica oleracea]